MTDRAVALLSGGLDSTTATCWALRQGLSVTALSVDYGQRQRVELDRARQVAARLGVAHRTVSLDLRAIGGSALTDASINIPKDRPDEAMARDVPVTYVPARNTVLLALALGLAEVVGASKLIIGANAIDYSGYPDCRPAFLQAFAGLASLATRAGTEQGVRFEVLAPLLDLTKAGIVKLALELGAPLDLTWTCYDPQPGEAACGRCDACLLRLKGFREAGAVDPARYADELPTSLRGGSSSIEAPRCPQARPYVVKEEAGATRWWCACGRSATQPFCDGSHAGTGLEPVETTIDRSRVVAWCGCKRTKTPPFCDGSHSSL